MTPVVLGLTGGGTAGHVWPHFALFEGEKSAIAHAWNQGSLRVVYFGGREGMERELVESNMGEKWTYVSLCTGKLRRYFSFRNFTDPFRIILGYFQAVSHLRRNRVDVLFSKGGFVAAPVVWAAWTLRIPVVIHESDLTPALATKLSVPFARVVLTSFSETLEYLKQKGESERFRVLGLPLRASLFQASRIEAREHFNLKTQKPVLLVFGGSLGAAFLNECVRMKLDDLLEKFEIVHIVGRGKIFETSLNQKEAGYHQYDFLGHEMPMAYACADFALCRAGASSIFELAAAQIPMLLVPLDTDQSRGDQIVNAREFVRKGWARCLRESQLRERPESLLAELDALVSSAVRMRDSLSQAPGADAATRVSELLWQLGSGHRRQIQKDPNKGTNL